MIFRRFKRLAVPAAVALAAFAAIAWGQFAPNDTPPAAAAGVDLVYGPYVNAVTPTSATIHWIAPAGITADCKIAGEAASVKLSSVPIPGRSERRNTATLTGLKPDHALRYAITAGRDHVEGSFHTPPPVGAKKPFTFAVIGDTQSWPLRIRSIDDALTREAPAFYVHTGDCCDDGQRWDLWEREFFGPARELLRQTPVWNCRGNHEHGTEPFATIFNLESKSPWHSFDYGNVHIAILDQWDLTNDRNMEPERMTAMAAWLDKDLAAAKGHADWIVVAGHQGVFNVAGHGSTWGHKEILPILYKHGVDLFVCGHSHLYERFVPIGPAGAKPIQFIVAGGGGGYSYPSAPSPILIKTYAAPHYCLYHVNGERLELTVKGPDGSLIDEVAFTKSKGSVAPAVLEAAISPEDAMKLLKLYKGFALTVIDPLTAGKPMACSFSPGRFPAGSRITISTDPGSLWTVQQASFEAPKMEPSAELLVPQKEGDKIPPAILQLTPPPGVLLDQGQVFSPPLSVAISLEYKGRTWVTPSVAVGIHEESLRRLAPQPEVVGISPAPPEVALDGDLAEWKSIPFLHLPATGGDSATMKLAWDRDALVGAVMVPQGEIHTDLRLPWNADSLEIDIEADALRRVATSPRSVPLKLFVSPAGEGNKATIRHTSGLYAGGSVQAAWRKTAAGYALEFRISAKALTPTEPQAVGTNVVSVPKKTPTLPLAAERTIGLDLILRHDGFILEQFANTTPFRASASSPIFWGQIRLQRAP